MLIMNADIRSITGKLLILRDSTKYILRWIELIVFFIGIPLLYWLDLMPFHKAIPLLFVFSLFLVILLLDKRFDKKVFRLRNFTNWKKILLRILIFTAISVVALYFVKPNSLFDTPRKMPLVWIMVLIFYPLWSAFPQELIFRAYFFHRYGKLLSNEKILILLNASLFAFSHIIFNNWLAIVLTFIGSILFTLTYKKSKSLMVVFIEHALYGNIIFTIGLGDYFYVPTPV